MLRESGARGPPHFGLPGLSAPVRVPIDRWGVPHIYAQSEHDLFFAQGAIHARERLFQLDLLRRAGRGRLSEIFGQAALDADRYFRRLGIGRVADAERALLDTGTAAVFDAYAQGINAATRTQGRPFEHRLLRAPVDPWTIADSLVCGRMMALTLSGSWEADMARLDLVSALGAERAGPPAQGVGRPTAGQAR